jgi:hypothetical protein
MEALRYFKASQVLRVAASELAERLPLMKVSDKLSFIAEVCLTQVLELAWAQLTERYGEPARDSDGNGFAIIAYGKLGGIELSYSSDLDLVFVFDAKPGGSTSGERAIDNATFYTRLGQRIIHILETRTSLGQLYEVDMRLRPSGASGLLVSSLEAFDRYQREDAWTWEQQALVRARAVAGDPALIARVEALRRARLCAAREAKPWPPRSWRCARKCAATPACPPTPRSSTSSRAAAVSWISNLWCNTRSLPGPQASLNWPAGLTTCASWIRSPAAAGWSPSAVHSSRKPTWICAVPCTSSPCSNRVAACPRSALPRRRRW